MRRLEIAPKFGRSAHHSLTVTPTYTCSMNFRLYGGSHLDTIHEITSTRVSHASPRLRVRVWLWLWPWHQCVVYFLASSLYQAWRKNLESPPKTVAKPSMVGQPQNSTLILLEGTSTVAGSSEIIAP